MSHDTPRFDYATAFSRNLGWTTEWEQAALGIKCVAIAGLGGVGGAHLLTLARLGIGQFHIADFDRFDMVNLNRQAGATMASLGRPKVDVLADMALSINPDIRLARFADGVTSDNLDGFLSGCDLFVDGLDFFALNIRAQVFKRCADLGIPAITAAPIGMGSGFLAFLPGGMSFESYFRLEGQSVQEQYLRFLLGVAPRGVHRRYLVDDTRVDLARQRGPSTAAACELCAGVVATQAMKLLLGRGDVPRAPVHLQFDAYRGLVARTRLRWGNAGPLQQLKLAVGRCLYGSRMTLSGGVADPPGAIPVSASSLAASPMMAILDLARWAPSGDNAQPWRFEPLDSETVVVHLINEAGTNPYEYRDNEPALLAGGMLLESIKVAASLHGLVARWTIEPEGPPWRARVELSFDDNVAPSPLAAALPMRSVARRSLGMRRLTEGEKAALQAALGPGLVVTWYETLRERMIIARLGAMATGIRLRLPEAFAVHQNVVDWERDRSPDRMPARALGLNRPTLMLMRWAMQRWSRMVRLNAVLGTGGVALQTDWWTGLTSAAFFAVRVAPGKNDAADGGANRTAALLETGERLQRFWLTATRLGLAVQPTMATLIFADYGANAARFTENSDALARAKRLAGQAEAFLGPLPPLRFIGRIGAKRDGLPGPRSVRKPLQDLLWRSPD
jgi:molybdopterin/thiamine biosynthesis adenylyltransferase